MLQTCNCLTVLMLKYVFEEEWCDFTHPSSSGKEARGVSVVNATKSNGSSRKRSSRLASNVGSRVVGIHLIGCPGGVHLLRSLPAHMVGVRIANLHHKLLIVSNGIDTTSAWIQD